jgi:predicted dehydrogenase
MTDGIITAPGIGLGVVGAGGFATFLLGATATLPEVTVRSVADARPEAAHRLADAHGARVAESWTDVLTDTTVDVVVVATTPDSHASIARAALEAGKHVFVEKPLALDDAEARELVHTVERTGQVLVVDHVLRYNPLLRALSRLRGSLLGPVQRFCFENDASDQDLHPGHWFWDEARSGGIFVEHGVHFFDAAAMLIDGAATSVQATAARRADGPIDLV